MILSILTFLIVLSVLVLVHELGHYVAAKKAGVWVEEFGFGLPPRVFGKKVGETIYSINLLPFGGFVRLHGENTEEQISNPKRAFLTKSKWSRTKIVLAGVLMNFLLAVLAFGITYSFLGIPTTTENVKVVEVREGSPATDAGFKNDDIVRTVNGMPVTTNEEFISLVEGFKGKEVVITVERGEAKEIVALSSTPRENPPEGEGALGVIISSTENYFPPLLLRPFYGIYHGFKDALFWGWIVLSGLFTMIRDLFGGVVPKDVAGPVGIYALTSQAAQYGFFTLLNFMGVLSVNLAILNVLPFPALDGGRLLFILIESIMGKKVVPKVEAAIHTVGIIILITMILAITANDIRKLVTLGGVSGYLDSVLK